jgi:outer membrane receptor for ferrienterochelin and colicin
MRHSFNKGRTQPKTVRRTFQAITPVQAAVCVALYGMLPAAHAQEATTTQEPTGALQEVTVTATRRTQTLEAVPYSLSVVSADRLEESGVTDLASLSTEVPGLSMYEYSARLAGATVGVAASTCTEKAMTARTLTVLSSTRMAARSSSK